MASGENYCTLLKRLLLAGVRRRRLLLILLVLYVVTTYFLRHSLWNALEHVRYKVTPLKEDLRTYRELIFLQVLFRHGHHSPFSSYPNDPISDSYWHEGMGQLTKLGRLQHYVVGKYLRHYYDGFLGYNVQEVDCLSSITFRSLYGAYAFLAGLYPSPPGRKLDEELSWQPVPCSFLPLNKDKYLQSLPNCAAAELDKSAMFKSKEAMEFMAPYRKLYKFWTKHSGLNVTTYGDAGSLYKTLLAEKTQNLTLPRWAEDTWDELEHQSNVCYHFHFRTRLLHRLRAGPVIGKIVTRMQNKIKHPEDKLKVYVYSGHGSNVAAVLQALRVFNQRIPTYSSSILFELYREEGGNHSVRILLLNATEPEKYIPSPHVLYMPGCDEFCSIEVLERSTADLFPLEWEKECMEANEKRIWKVLNPPPDRPLGYYY